MLLELRRLHVDPDAVGGEKIGRSPTERFRALHAITDASHQGGRASAGHASGVAGAAGPRHSPRAGRLWRRWQPAARRARHRDARQLLQARRHPGAGRHPGALLQRGPAVHNAVAANGGWSTPLSIQSGDAATVTLSKPGVYRFYCTFHGTSDGQGMAGTIVVGDVRYETSESTTGRDLPVVRQASGVTRRVPQDYRTIQAAVNAASPGDLVLVGPGVYREEVKVTIPSLVIRGTDRNQVVVDGEFRRPNAISVTADGVAVENLTVRNAVANGLFWTGV